MLSSFRLYFVVPALLLVVVVAVVVSSTKLFLILKGFFSLSRSPSLPPSNLSTVRPVNQLHPQTGYKRMDKWSPDRTVSLSRQLIPIPYHTMCKCVEHSNSTPHTRSTHSYHTSIYNCATPQPAKSLPPSLPSLPSILPSSSILFPFLLPPSLFSTYNLPLVHPLNKKKG